MESVLASCVCVSGNAPASLSDFIRLNPGQIHKEGEAITKQRLLTLLPAVEVAGDRSRRFLQFEAMCYFQSFLVAG